MKGYELHLLRGLDVAAVGDDEPIPLLDRPWLDQIRAEPDPHRVIALWVGNGGSILARVAPIMGVVRDAAGHDPEMAAQWAANEQQRVTAFHLLAQLLADRNSLRSGMSMETATDIIFALLSIELYLLFTATRGWTPETVAGLDGPHFVCRTHGLTHPWHGKQPCARHEHVQALDSVVTIDRWHGTTRVPLLDATFCHPAFRRCCEVSATAASRSTMPHVDHWYATGNKTRELVETFLYWARSHRLCSREIDIPAHRSESTDVFGEAERIAEIRRILLDDEFALADRVIAGPVLLFGQR